MIIFKNEAYLTLVEEYIFLTYFHIIFLKHLIIYFELN